MALGAYDEEIEGKGVLLSKPSGGGDIPDYSSVDFERVRYQSDAVHD